MKLIRICIVLLCAAFIALAAFVTVMFTSLKMSVDMLQAEAAANTSASDTAETELLTGVPTTVQTDTETDNDTAQTTDTSAQTTVWQTEACITTAETTTTKKASAATTERKPTTTAGKPATTAGKPATTAGKTTTVSPSTTAGTTAARQTACWGSAGEMTADCESAARRLGYTIDRSLGRDNSHWIDPYFTGAFTSASSLKAAVEDYLSTFRGVGYSLCSISFESAGSGEYYVWIYLG